MKLHCYDDYAVNSEAESCGATTSNATYVTNIIQPDCSALSRNLK